jgi:hypothetical protein
MTHVMSLKALPGLTDQSSFIGDDPEVKTYLTAQSLLLKSTFFFLWAYIVMYRTMAANRDHSRCRRPCTRRSHPHRLCHRRPSEQSGIKLHLLH